MRIDGKALAKNIRDELTEMFKTLRPPLRITVFSLSEDEVTRQYLGIKERTGSSLGVSVMIEHLSVNTRTAELTARIKEAAKKCDGIIVQLPLPEHIDMEALRSAIPRSKDIDCLGTDAYDAFEAGVGAVMPPVVAAIGHILRLHGVPVADKRAVIIGRGRLVGAPAAIWFSRRGAAVDVCDENTKDIPAHTKDADIIVLGAGAPGLLKPAMIKEGIVILDAGASEAGGKVVGDAEPACEEKAALFTPVPGGIGPIAIAMLLRNLYILRTDEEHAHNGAFTRSSSVT